MTDEQFAVAAEKLRARGLNVTGTAGTVSKDGVTARYQHAEGKLTIEILEKPSFFPLSMVESQLQAYLNSGDGGHTGSQASHRYT